MVWSLKLPTCQWKKTHQVVWDILIDYRRLEWQSILLDLEKAPGVAYEDALRELGEV